MLPLQPGLQLAIPPDIRVVLLQITCKAHVSSLQMQQAMTRMLHRHQWYEDLAAVGRRP